MPHTDPSHPSLAAAVISNRAPGFKPKLGLILGSGLGSVADQIQNAIRIPYSELPDFPVSTVAGHEGCLVLGTIKNVPVACYQGRVHHYEGATAQNFKTFIRTLKLIGCETLLITNSAGSLRTEFPPGSLVVIKDHINFHPGNPLAGSNDEEFGPRFFPMDNAYDPSLRQRFTKAAHNLKIPLHEGVYISVLGPSFETPAEINAFKILGADIIGMSTVPEVIVARHCGLKVAAVSVVTNFASGLSEEQITHEGTLHYGKLGAINLSKLILTTIESFSHDA